MSSSAHQNIVIAADGLGKRYRLYRSPMRRMISALSGERGGSDREHWALRDISFELQRGRTLGIIGENGSGKSTLLQLIAGTLTPTAGRIHVKARVAALLELGAGFDSESTGRENVFMTGALLGLSHEEVRERFASIEAFAEIGSFIEQPVRTYSSGMFLRLAFAVIAHVDAEVLIIDEALAVGDVYFTQRCMRFLNRFMERGSVLFVSHDMAAVRALADEVLWLHHGRLRERGHPKAVGDAYLRANYARNQTVQRAIVKSASPELENDRLIPRDCRYALMQQPDMQNSIQVFRFTEDEEGFGDGAATIGGVELIDAGGETLSSTCGGEDVTLSVTIEVHRSLRSPIAGFFLRNRLGQNIFGDNTETIYRADPLSCVAGSTLIACFSFRMPFLPVGDYSFCVAIASGNKDQHVQHHWRNEALVIRSLSANVHADILGLPMHAMTIECVPRGSP